MSSSQGAFAGQVLGGRYRLEKLLGRGGVGEVYEAVQEPLGRRVAVKVLLRGEQPMAEDETVALVRLEREAYTTAALGHPNIVQVTDFAPPRGGEPAFLVMELLKGLPLDAILRSPFRPPMGWVVSIAQQVLSALSAAHGAGVIHRDIKPENIFVTPVAGGNDLVRVLDFGLAKPAMRTPGERQFTSAGLVVGTLRYMSPEQVEDKPLDGRTDLFSLGVVLYQTLCNAFPFDGADMRQVVIAILTRNPVPIRQLQPEVPEALAAVVHRALCKNREERFASAEAMQAALAPFVTTSGAFLPDTLIDRTPRATAPSAGAGSPSQRGSEPPSLAVTLISPSGAADLERMPQTQGASKPPSLAVTLISPSGAADLGLAGHASGAESPSRELVADASPTLRQPSRPQVQARAASNEPVLVGSQPPSGSHPPLASSETRSSGPLAVAPAPSVVEGDETETLPHLRAVPARPKAPLPNTSTLSMSVGQRVSESTHQRTDPTQKADPSLTRNLILAAVAAFLVLAIAAAVVVPRLSPRPSEKQAVAGLPSNAPSAPGTPAPQPPATAGQGSQPSKAEPTAPPPSSSEAAPDSVPPSPDARPEAASADSRPAGPRSMAEANLASARKTEARPPKPEPGPRLGHLLVIARIQGGARDGQPLRATLRVDGEDRGQTQTMLRDLPVGTHDVEVRPGEIYFKRATLKARIQAGKTTTLKVAIKDMRYNALDTP